MAEWTLKYADARGAIHQQVAEAASERELRDRFSQQGFLIYSIKPRIEGKGVSGTLRPSGKKINVEKFLIFNQQFVTLLRAGLPILKALDLLADRLTDPKLSKYINGVREEIRNGALLSDAFAKQGVFPPIYVTSVLAGERSGCAGVPGRLPDCVPGHLRRAELCRTLCHHGRAIARADPHFDCDRDHGAKLCDSRLCGAGGRDFRVSILGANAGGR
jgi:Type II secretion system (T2SS), protein F